MSARLVQPRQVTECERDYRSNVQCHPIKRKEKSYEFFRDLKIIVLSIIFIMYERMVTAVTRQVIFIAKKFFPLQFTSYRASIANLES